MATYLLVNVIFVMVVIGIFRVRIRIPARSTWIALAVLIILTAIFDSLIIYFGIVGYDISKILGIYIGQAPIEDFFYAILALLIVVTVWNTLGSNDASKD